MTKPFIHEDFLLETESACRLYHGYAEGLPIIDYHCHLSPQQVAEDARFANLAQVWLYGDHYKWRSMRTNGIAERFCTGDASDWEKFEKWAETVPRTLGNPHYHWTHLELANPFGISDRLLSPATARGIWDECNAMLARPEFSARGIMEQMNVAAVCTTDDPTDDLRHHKAIAADEHFRIQVRPTFRPDKAMAVEAPELFNQWVDRLGAAADMDIGSYSRFLEALRRRHDAFHEAGCRLSDHGLETAYAEPCTDVDASLIFNKIRAGEWLDAHEIFQFKSIMMFEFGQMDWEKGWVQQMHFGPMRNNNSRLFNELGPDTGFDSMGDQNMALPLARMLDHLDREGTLAKTILYNLNPRDNEMMAAMIGNFQDGSTPGKIQWGSAWWFLDQEDGMRKQLIALGNMGLLSRFVGMLTDSRSFLSYTRHEYFRRILCNLFGAEMERGAFPMDEELVGAMVRDICFNNAASYFDFGLEPLGIDTVTPQLRQDRIRSLR